MTFERQGREPLKYFPCRYGKSKILFRGPKRDLTGKYLAMLGGTETYGRFLKEPFPKLVEKALGVTAVNFGCVNAGIDVFRAEPTILAACDQAAVTVIQIVGAQNMSNRFYSVHPRRNDRFIRASALMKTIFREVDFTEFNFTRHMLTTLRTLSPERFEVVKDELRVAWLARMNAMIAGIQGPVVLLWFAERTPDDEDSDIRLGADPLFITRQMVEALRPGVAAIVEATPSAAAMLGGTDGMVLSPLDAPAADAMLGVRAHREAAEALARSIETLL